LPFCAPKKYWELNRNNTENYIQNPIDDYSNETVGVFPVKTKRGELFQYDGIEITGQGKIEKNTYRKLVNGYLASISYVDAQIGKVLSSLRENDLLKNTMIVFCSDHGFIVNDKYFGKGTLKESNLKVPLIIYIPNEGRAKFSQITKNERKKNHIIGLIDITPTIIEWAELDLLDQFQGNSFLRLLRERNNDEALEAKEENFDSEFSYTKIGYRYYGYSIRKNDYRYTQWRELKYRKEGYSTNYYKIIGEEFYDLSTDVSMSNNLISSLSHEKTLRSLKEDLEIHLSSTNNNH